MDAVAILLALAVFAILLYLVVAVEKI